MLIDWPQPGGTKGRQVVLDDRKRVKYSTTLQQLPSHFLTGRQQKLC